MYAIDRYQKRVRFYKTLFPMSKKYREISKKRKQKIKNERDVSRGMREFIFWRDKFTCLRCGEGRRWLLTIDHVVPFSKGGTKETYNLQTLCLKCNEGKKDTYQDFRLAKIALIRKIIFILQQRIDTEYGNVSQTTIPMLYPLHKDSLIGVRLGIINLNDKTDANNF